MILPELSKFAEETARDIIRREPKDWTDAEREFISSLIPKRARECGSCSLCCVAPVIEEEHCEKPYLPYPKPAGVRCAHLSACGKACSVYAERPSICRTYYCLYTLGLIDESPADTGVAWSLQSPPELMGGVILMGHTIDVRQAMQDRRNWAVAALALLDWGVVNVAMRDSRIAYMFIIDPERPWVIISRMADISRTDPLHFTVDIATERVGDLACVFQPV